MTSSKWGFLSLLKPVCCFKTYCGEGNVAAIFIQDLIAHCCRVTDVIVKLTLSECSHLYPLLSRISWPQSNRLNNDGSSHGTVPFCLTSDFRWVSVTKYWLLPLQNGHKLSIFYYFFTTYLAVYLVHQGERYILLGTQLYVTIALLCWRLCFKTRTSVYKNVHVIFIFSHIKSRY